MLIKTKLTQRGDTIIEVLFAVVMIGATLIISFSISNRSLQISRASQEQAEALKIAESKIELIKIAHRDGIGGVAVRNDNFCINLRNTGGIQVVNVSPVNCTNETINGGSGGLFTITSDGPQSSNYSLNNPSTYRVQVTWDRIGTNSSEKGNVVLYYRTGEL